MVSRRVRRERDRQEHRQCFAARSPVMCSTGIPAHRPAHATPSTATVLGRRRFCPRCHEVSQAVMVEGRPVPGDSTLLITHVFPIATAPRHVFANVPEVHTDHFAGESVDPRSRGRLENDLHLGISQRCCAQERAQRRVDVRDHHADDAPASGAPQGRNGPPEGKRHLHFRATASSPTVTRVHLARDRSVCNSRSNHVFHP